MSTLNDKKIEVDILQPISRKTGPKKKALPTADIQKLANDGMGSKAIASKLKQRNIIVSYKTIQRVLAGKRC